jgi:uncharacterized tellurite resistance protein B-like protein
MFLDALNLEQKEAFLKLAIKFIAVDNEIKQAEKDLLEIMVLEMTVDEKSLDLRKNLKNNPEEDTETLLNVFKDKDSQQIILMQLYIIAYADNKLAFEENNFIHLVMDHFGISEEKANKLKNWVNKQGDLISEIMEIWD